MLPFNYIICSNQIGNGNFGKVFKIKEINPPHNVLIVKIYDQHRQREYENEKNILTIITENNNFINDYIIKLNNTEVILENSDDFPINSNKLIFNYLNHGQLCDYLYIIPNINHLKECHIKLLCYKLLQGIKKCHEKNISHNKIDLKNIMLDNDFNPIIIHFSEASIIHDNNFKNDFFGLGIVLAKLITSGKFKSIGYEKKRNKYFIKFNDLNNQFQKNVLEESIFWKKVEILHNIKISEEFKKFFGILIKSKDILNIDDLLKNEWLKDINNNKDEIEIDLKKQFQKLYDRIIEYQNIDKYQIDNISSILNFPMEIETNLIKECLNKKKSKNKNLLDNYTNFYEYKKSISIFSNNSEYSDNGIQNYDISSEEEEKKGKKKLKKYKDDEDEDEDEEEKKEKKKEGKKEDDDEDEDEELTKKKGKKKMIKIEKKKEIKENKKRKKSKKNKKSKISPIEFIYQNKEIQIIQYEPQGIQFNYIEINFKDNNDYDCQNTLNKYMINLEKNIKEFNYEKFINIKTEFLNKYLGFKVTFEEFIDEEENSEEEDLDYLNDDINNKDLIFLIMKIELFKLEEKEYTLNNKYYLFFNLIQGDIVDFYEYLKIVKIIATSLLNH